MIKKTIIIILSLTILLIVSINKLMSFEYKDIKMTKYYSAEYELSDIEEKSILLKANEMNCFFIFDFSFKCYSIAQRNFLEVNLKNNISYAVYLNHKKEISLICVNKFPMYIGI